MFDLEDTLNARLDKLRGGKGELKNKDGIQLNDTSPEYIRKSLMEAGILDKDGKLRDMVKL